MRSIRLIAVPLIAMVAFVARAADTYTGDPVHSSLIFKSTHLNNTTHVYGRFNGPKSTITVENGDLASVEASVETKNVDTGVEKRDNHLRSPDFFNAAEFPQITFKSTDVKKMADNKSYQVTGDLTLHGVTKSITTTVTKTGESDSPQMGHRTGWESTFSLKRSDYGMNNMMGMVGDEIEITIAIEAKK